MAVAFNCKFNPNYKCPVDCKNLDISNCQFRIIAWTIGKIWSENAFNFLPWEYPSIGTCMINGKKCSF